MNRVWQLPVTLTAGLVLTAMYAMPQAYTVSARPGAINYIEGHAALNGQELSAKNLRATFLNANDTLSTDLGKAEVLLTPGVFLRVGNNSEIRMISPSLTETQLEVIRGEAMIEADGLLKDNHVAVIDHGASTTLLKDGLYRFTADPEPAVAVLDGKAQVYVGDRKLDLGKGREAVLSADLRPAKFNTKQPDDLFAWSNTRSEYDAAASYQSAKNVSLTNPNLGFGFGGWYGPGWYWNTAFSGWGWIPGNSAFYSPFGWGFYGAGLLPYAPVIVVPVGGLRGVVPVNPNNPPTTVAAASPAANLAARAQVARAAAVAGGFRTATGAPTSSFTANSHATAGHFSGPAASGGARSSGGGRR